MARKDAVSDWSVTPNSNDNVGGVNIAENCAAANLNNAIRTVMAQIKTYTLTAEPGALYVTKAANYTAILADDNVFFRFTNNATLSLTAAATLTNGWHCLVMADGADVTITPNGAETVNGAATLELIDGYSAIIVCSGTAFYAVTVASQDVVEGKLDELQPYISVASAATTDIGAILSQNVTITGTTTITSFGTVAAGTVRNVVFSGALTLTHNATSLILPYGANITTAARESIRAVSLGSGNWRVTDYQKSAAPALTVSAGLSSTGSIAAGNMAVALDLYAGTSAGQTDFPIGHMVVVNVFANINRNSTIAICLDATDGGSYVTSTHPDAGSPLTGTWRVRGGIGPGGGSNDYYLAVKIAD